MIVKNKNCVFVFYKSDAVSLDNSYLEVAVACRLLTCSSSDPTGYVCQVFYDRKGVNHWTARLVFCPKCTSNVSVHSHIKINNYSNICLSRG